MGFMSKLLGEENGAKAAPGSAEYIDLTDFKDDLPARPAARTTLIKVAELQRYEDLREFSSFVYDGNVLILDYGAVAKDEIALRRVTSDLKKLATDVQGDLAGLGETTLIVTPTGVKIDRRKTKLAKA